MRDDLVFTDGGTLFRNHECHWPRPGLKTNGYDLGIGNSWSTAQCFSDFGRRNKKSSQSKNVAES